MLGNLMKWAACFQKAPWNISLKVIVYHSTSKDTVFFNISDPMDLHSHDLELLNYFHMCFLIFL